MKKSDNRPIVLRNVLLTTLLLLAVAISVGFYFAQSKLEVIALDISSSVSKSNQNLLNSKYASTLSSELVTKQKVISIAEGFYYSSNNYQSDAVIKLKQLASDSGINVTDYKFDTEQNNTPVISLTLDKSVQYTNLLKFIGSVEQSTPKMQISGLVLSRIEGSNGLVKVDDIKIGIYIK